MRSSSRDCSGIRTNRFSSTGFSISIIAAAVLVMAAVSGPGVRPAFAGLQSSALKNPLVIAHRGGRQWAPENTMAAFRKSLEAGADGIELDIHKCKTGELVVIHDETVDRTTDGKGFIKDMTWNDLRKLSAGKGHADFQDEHLPLLSDVLALVDGKMLINIEIKNAPVAYPGIEDDLIALLKGYKRKDKILVSSFDHEVIRRFHTKMPEVAIGFLDSCIMADIGDYASKLGAKAWHPGYGDIRADAVSQAHQSGLAVNVWTVNGNKNWAEAISMGVDGIVTDDPAGLIQYLGKHKGDEGTR